MTQAEDLVEFSNKLQLILPVNDSIHIIDNISKSRDTDAFLERRLFEELTELRAPKR
jgi:hypothetical protein